MEQCTVCSERIRWFKEDAEVDGLLFRVIEVRPTLICPTDALVFVNMADPRKAWH